MKNSLSSAVLSSALVIALLSTNALAQVKSVSGEDFVQYGSEDAYWVFTAVCGDDSERKIQRKTDGTTWCGKDIDTYCDADKGKAAELICGSEYSNILESRLESARAEEARNRAAQEERNRQQRQQQADRQRAAQEQARRQRAAQAAAAASGNERIAIEEELIAIEQEKIKLRREELELQRRAKDIETALGIEPTQDQ